MDLLLEQAARIRASDALGRSRPMRRLFDFLVTCSSDGTTPREVDIAIEVFDRSEGFDVSQDASVRVYMHRLRQKLDDFYAGEGRGEGVRLVIPKGDYRLVVEEMPPVEDDADSAGHRLSRGRLAAYAVAALALILAINAGVWTALWPKPTEDALTRARASALWAPILNDTRPVIIAVGDYYIFGELGKDLSVQRLIREYSVNSREDLYEYQMLHPDAAENYVDMGLRYLPTSTAYALTRMLPLMSTSEAATKRLRVILASELTPDMMKMSDVIYIGYLSALGSLRDPMFAGSRYAIGNTYDEIVDRASGEHYISHVNNPDGEEGTSLDYGLVSTFKGPTGNHILIVAGTRDVAIRQVAEEVTEPSALNILAAAEKDDSVEALYAVDAMEQYNMDAKLLAASPLETAKIWSGTAPQNFPQE